MQMLPKLAANPANKVIVVPADMAGLAGLATSLTQIVQEQQGAPVKLIEGSTANGTRPQLNATNTAPQS